MTTNPVWGPFSYSRRDAAPAPVDAELLQRLQRIRRAAGMADFLNAYRGPVDAGSFAGAGETGSGDGQY